MTRRASRWLRSLLSHAQKEIVTVWSLAQLLPASLADYFDAFVVSFLQKPLQFREQLSDVTSRDETLAKETEFLRRYVKGDLATELIRSVGPARTLKRRSPSSSSRATRRPRVPEGAAAVLQADEPAAGAGEADLHGAAAGPERRAGGDRAGADSCCATSA